MTGEVVGLDRYSRLLNYYSCLPAEQSFQLAVKGIFELVMDASLPVMLQCEGGTDRTGMVVAVLMDAVGVDRKDIVRDYLMSYRHADARLLKAMFVRLEKEGGVESFGISHEMVDKARGRLRANPRVSKRNSHKEKILKSQGTQGVRFRRNPTAHDQGLETNSFRR